MRKISGPLLIIIGILHTFYGLVGGWPVWVEIGRNGFFDTLGSAISRSTEIFWFTFAGPMYILFGQLCLWVEREFNRPVPLFIAIELSILSFISAVLDLITGFWLVLAVAINMIIVAKRVSKSALPSAQ
ncbi:MAG: hypothetical protein HY707_07625 [Ignavibacteriae bacterium]|nr:hypothetical protein [Ignavibacteriota bacterium]